MCSYRSVRITLSADQLAIAIKNQGKISFFHSERYLRVLCRSEITREHYTVAWCVCICFVYVHAYVHTYVC